MADTYEGPSLTLTAPEYHGPITYEYPFVDFGDMSHFVASEVYRVLASDYEPPALNSTRTLKSATAYCVGDSTPIKLEAGLVEFVRRWATVPAEHDDFQTLSYQFPGYKYNDGFEFQARGEPRSLSVSCRVTSEYFLTDPADIAIISRQRYILTYGSQGNSDVDYVLFSGAAGFQTAPTAPEYQTMVANGTEIIAEDSYIERYAGNIWCRITKRVVAR